MSCVTRGRSRSVSTTTTFIYIYVYIYVCVSVFVLLFIACVWHYTSNAIWAVDPTRFCFCLLACPQKRVCFECIAVLCYGWTFPQFFLIISCITIQTTHSTFVHCMQVLCYGRMRPQDLIFSQKHLSDLHVYKPCVMDGRSHSSFLLQAPFIVVSV